MGPQPTGRPGLLRVPAPPATALAMRYAPLADRDDFDPATWPLAALAPSSSYAGWWELDLDALALPDGRYEYEFVLTTAQITTPLIVPDPYAQEITRFGGYRGVFTISARTRVLESFRWDATIEGGAGFAPNNRIVIYEMPLRWMSSAAENSLVEAAYPTYVIPGWPWAGAPLTEIGYAHAPPAYDAGSAALTLSLEAFEVRVFTV